MRVGEIIQQYRDKHEMTMEQFAALCGLTKGYISMLESNQHPKTKKPITPSIPVMRRIGELIGDEFFDLLDDDQKINIRPTVSKDDLSLTPREHKVIIAYRAQPAKQPAVDTLLGIGASVVNLAAKGGVEEHTVESDPARAESANNAADSSELDGE